VADDQIDNTLDAVLVLGMAFDRRGYRLGHGGGYFDRFLAGRPFPAIALAYDFQVLDRVPAEPHDIPMSVVVTETQTLRPAMPSPSVPLD
jgi:5-formyltetrahydrofolate cyclo-ligase